jgi:hypothetical protein
MPTADFSPPRTINRADIAAILERRSDIGDVFAEVEGHHHRPVPSMMVSVAKATIDFLRMTCRADRLPGSFWNSQEFLEQLAKRDRAKGGRRSPRWCDKHAHVAVVVACIHYGMSAEFTGSVRQGYVLGTIIPIETKGDPVSGHIIVQSFVYLGKGDHVLTAERRIMDGTPINPVQLVELARARNRDVCVAGIGYPEPYWKWREPIEARFEAKGTFWAKMRFTARRTIY